MSCPGTTLSLEAQILAVFQRACAEDALEIADRLLSILELMDREPSNRSRLEPHQSGDALSDAYRAVTRGVRRVRKH